MLNDGTEFKNVYVATGFKEMRRGIDGLTKMHSFFSLSWMVMVTIHYFYFAVSVQATG